MLGDEALRLRLEIFGKIQNGKWPPHLGEAVAARLGLKPLREVPDPAEFSPYKEPYWTLPMVLSWIIWRTEDAVRERYWKYRERYADWHFARYRVPVDGGKDWRVLSGHELKTRTPETSKSLQIWYHASHIAEPHSALTNYSDAREELETALQQNLLSAIGLNENGDVCEIPAREWAYLYLVVRNDADVLMAGNSGSQPRYTDLKIEHRKVLDQWPKRWLDMQEAITLLAYGTSISGDPFYKYLLSRDALPSKLDKVPADPKGLNLKFNQAFQEICDGARLGSLTIYARRPLARKDEVSYPSEYGDFQKISADAFIDSFSFGPGDPNNISDPQSLYSRHENPFLARWFFPRVIDAEFRAWIASRSSLVEGVQEDWSVAGNPSKTHTGLRGRPTARHLIQAEFQRMVLAGEHSSVLAENASALKRWLENSHREIVRPTEKVIAEQIRSLHQKAKAGK